MIPEESELNARMSLLEKHSPEWEALYEKWCVIQRKKKNKTLSSDKQVFIKTNQEEYKIKAQYL